MVDDWATRMERLNANVLKQATILSELKGSVDSLTQKLQLDGGIVNEYNVFDKMSLPGNSIVPTLDDRRKSYALVDDDLDCGKEYCLEIRSRIPHLSYLGDIGWCLDDGYVDECLIRNGRELIGQMIGFKDNSDKLGDDYLENKYHTFICESLAINICAVPLCSVVVGCFKGCPVLFNMDGNLHQGKARVLPYKVWNPGVKALGKNIAILHVEFDKESAATNVQGPWDPGGVKQHVKWSSKNLQCLLLSIHFEVPGSLNISNILGRMFITLSVTDKLLNNRGWSRFLSLCDGLLCSSERNSFVIGAKGLKLLVMGIKQKETDPWTFDRTRQSAECFYVLQFDAQVGNRVWEPDIGIIAFVHLLASCSLSRLKEEISEVLDKKFKLQSVTTVNNEGRNRIEEVFIADLSDGENRVITDFNILNIVKTKNFSASLADFQKLIISIPSLELSSGPHFHSSEDDGFDIHIMAESKPKELNFLSLNFLSLKGGGELKLHSSAYHQKLAQHRFSDSKSIGSTARDSDIRKWLSEERYRPFERGKEKQLSPDSDKWPHKCWNLGIIEFGNSIVYLQDEVRKTNAVTTRFLLSAPKFLNYAMKITCFCNVATGRCLEEVLSIRLDLTSSNFILIWDSEVRSDEGFELVIGVSLVCLQYFIKLP